MKIRSISDLHFEVHKDRGVAFVESIPDDCDVLIIAGDLTTCHKGLVEPLGMFCEKFKNVIHVPGNHEYWGGSWDVVYNQLRDAKKLYPNLHIPNKDVVEIDGQRFLGATMWFSHSPAAQILMPFWSDFAAVKDLKDWVFKYNKEVIRFFEDELREGDVVVTHHLPSYKSVSPAYNNEDTNCYYVCSLDPLIKDRKPALWFHGHTHVSFDYTLGDTRIICNPYGYQMNNLLNREFKPDLLIETQGE